MYSQMRPGKQAAGGRFILSTGGQCGRDTPDRNLSAMIETAKTSAGIECLDFFLSSRGKPG